MSPLRLKHTVGRPAIDDGGERGAAIYTLIGTAKLNGLDPEGYRDTSGTSWTTADHLVNKLDELLPWKLADARVTQRR